MLNKVREMVIVPNEDKIKAPIYERKLSVNEPHGLAVEEFSNKYYLGINSNSLGLQENDYQNIHWYLALTKMGHAVIQKDDMVVLYLPTFLTLNQYQYLLSKKDEIIEYGKDFHMLSIYQEDGKFYENGIDNLLMEYDTLPINIVFQEITKKFQSAKHLIIIPNENILEIPNGVYEVSFPITVGHEVKMEEFSNLYHVGLYTELDTTGHEAALELANFGNAVINMEENVLVCYLPNKISLNQKNWLLDNKKLFTQFQVGGFLFEDRRVVPIEYDYENPSISLERIESFLIEKTQENVEKRK